MIAALYHGDGSTEEAACQRCALGSNLCFSKVWIQVLLLPPSEESLDSWDPRSCAAMFKIEDRAIFQQKLYLYNLGTRLAMCGSICFPASCAIDAILQMNLSSAHWFHCLPGFKLKFSQMPVAAKSCLSWCLPNMIDHILFGRILVNTHSILQMCYQAVLSIPCFEAIYAYHEIFKIASSCFADWISITEDESNC